MTQALETLLPCAHCGGKAELRTDDLDERASYGRVAYVRCRSCGAQTAKFYHDEPMRGQYADRSTADPKAITAWNTRKACDAGLREAIGDLPDRLFVAWIEEADDASPRVLGLLEQAANVLADIRKASQPKEKCDACNGAGGDGRGHICGKCDGAGGFSTAIASIQPCDAGLREALSLIADESSWRGFSPVAQVERIREHARAALSKGDATR